MFVVPRLSRLFLLFAAFALPAAAQDVVDAANTIFINARIYTVSAKQPWAEALAVRDGKILVVGGGGREGVGSSLEGARRCEDDHGVTSSIRRWLSAALASG